MKALQMNEKGKLMIMKILIRFILSFFFIFSLVGCSKTEVKQVERQEETEIKQEDQKEDDSKILVVYFSRTGNTKRLASAAISHLNCDEFEIEAMVHYSDSDIAYYTNCRADKEQNDKSIRVEIAGEIENIDQYDTIILGYPIWHGQAPRIIDTFIERYDLTNKTIIPFCTSASSGIGSSDTYLHSLTSNEVNWKEGKRFASDNSIEDFLQWIVENI